MNMTAKKIRHILCGLLVYGILWTATASERTLNIGITLHPYYSFVKNIVQDAARVTPLIAASSNSHAYNPLPEDIKKVDSLDCLVVNGIGHDEFAFQIIKASNKKGQLPLIYANEEVPLIPVAGYNSVERIVNPHTFISVQASIQQIYTISKHLQKLDPKNAAFYRKNTQAYAKKLRTIKAAYLKKLESIRSSEFLYATLHGGYDYLLQEFGLRVSAVIEPAHGANPTAAQLKETIDTIKRLGVDVLFTEANYSGKLAETIQRETEVVVSELSHLTYGEYTADNFEQGLIKNLENLTAAITAIHNKKKAG
ncbi:MAG: zinc ABC transporter substrate-binding protein [Treponema sp.]